MAIQDMAANYGLLPDYIEVEPNVGFKPPRTGPAFVPAPATDATAPAAAPPMDVSDAMSRRMMARPQPQIPTVGDEAIAAFDAASVTAQPPRRSLQDMSRRYEETYIPELRKANVRLAEEQAAFNDLVRQSLRETGEKPSKAELYFRLAAAFGTPTKTGSFFESLGVVGKEITDYLKDNRATEAATRANRLKTLFEARKISLQGARDEVNSIRNLAVEEIKNRGAQSPAGKQAQDEGLTPGTPEFNRRVGEIAQTGIDARLAQLNATIAQTEATMAGMTRAQSQEARATAAEERAERKDLRAADTETERLALERRRVEAQEAANRRREEESRRLTPKEVDLKTETENVISAADSGMRMLRRAYELNPNTFDTSLPDTLQRKALEAAGSKDPKLLRTRELENILGQQAITQLKTAFGGNPTEGERKILLDLQGLGAKSVQERSAILRNAFSALRSRREREQRRLSDITAGRYRETTPEPAGGE